MPRADRVTTAPWAVTDRPGRNAATRPGHLRRLLLPVLVVAAILSLTFGLDLTTAAPAEAQDVPPATNDGCGDLPIISDACRSLVAKASWIACPADGPMACASSLTQSVAADTFDYFAVWVATGAIAAIDMVWVGIDGTTTPTVDDTSTVFRTSMEAARALALPLLVLAALYSLLKRDASIAIKSAVFYLPGSVVAMVLAGYVINMLLAVTDELSRSYVQTGETGVAEWLTDLSGTIGAGVGVTSPVLLVIFSIVLIVGSIMVWLVMIVRTAAILVTYAFMPLVMIALIFPATRAWLRRTIEIQLAFLLTKPIIVGIIAIGSTTLNDTDNALVGMIQASALFYLAAFSPFALLKLLPFVADEAVAASFEHPQQTSSRLVSTTVGVVTGQKLAGFLAGSQQGGPAFASGSPGADSLSSPSGGRSGNGSGDGAATSGGAAASTPLGGGGDRQGGGADANGSSGRRQGAGDRGAASSGAGAGGGGSIEGGSARPHTGDFT